MCGSDSAAGKGRKRSFVFVEHSNYQTSRFIPHTQAFPPVFTEWRSVSSPPLSQPLDIFSAAAASLRLVLTAFFPFLMGTFSQVGWQIVALGVRKVS